MIGIGYCTKQSDKKIDNSNYINNMLMLGSGTSYDLKYHGNIPGYTTGDIVGCYLNFRENIVFYTKNGINLGNQHLELKVIFFKMNR
ncbi:hypothetical protein C2G38_1252418 [Gigaspora rosea]|uniref:B30.2/SPRY domain-containing protein n=1 Tax=Gigaspora rosea TaxID=44941 RepID=A0A397VF99_9GLOM|nr:hypothetical protein C2G38_1252418 [Gigaspora rosea]